MRTQRGTNQMIAGAFADQSYAFIVNIFYFLLKLVKNWQKWQRSEDLFNPANSSIVHIKTEQRPVIETELFQPGNPKTLGVYISVMYWIARLICKDGWILPRDWLEHLTETIHRATFHYYNSVDIFNGKKS